MDFSPEDRERILADAETLVPGLKKQFESGNRIPKEVFERLRLLQQQHPKQAERIGNILGLIQTTVRQQVGAISSEPLNTLRNVPRGDGKSAAMIRAAKQYLANKGGDPLHQVNALAKALSKPAQNISLEEHEENLVSLFLNLSVAGRDLSEISLQVTARALEAMVMQQPSWISRIDRKSFSSLQDNIKAATRDTGTIGLSAQTPVPGNGAVRTGPGGTRRDSQLAQAHASYRNTPPSTQDSDSFPMNEAAHSGNYNPMASLGGRPLGHPSTENLNLNQGATHGGAAGNNDNGDGFRFDEMFSGELDPFGASGPQSSPAPVASQPLEWHQKLDWQVVSDLQALAPDEATVGAEFNKICEEVFWGILSKVISSVPGIMAEIRRQKPNKVTQIMMESMLKMAIEYEPSFRQQVSQDKGLKPTYKAFGEECASLKKTLKLMPQIIYYYHCIPNQPGQVLSYLKKLEEADCTDPDVVLTIQALDKAFAICPKDPIPDVLVKVLQKNIQALDARRQLAPELLEGEGVKQNGWKIGRFLAAGGMGTVFIAQEVSYGKLGTRLAAVKVSQSDDDLSKRGFHREGRILAGVEGNHIVNVYKKGTTKEDNPFLVMEYVAGPERDSGAYDGDAFIDMLSECKEAGQSMPSNALSIVGWKLLMGVGEFQEKNIVQRDLKPANFLMTPRAAQAFLQWKLDQDENKLVDTLHDLIAKGDPIIKWTDFGLAKKMEEKHNFSGSPEQIQAELERRINAGEIGLRTSFTLTDGAIVGSPGYMTPEMAMGEPVDEFLDQYALGIILFRIFSGGGWPTEPMPRTALGLMREGLTLSTQNRPSYVLPEDERISHLHQHQDAHVLPSLMADLTDLQDPSRRGTIAEAQETLRRVAMASSPESRQAKADRAELIDATAREDEALFEVRSARQGQDTLRQLLMVLGTVSVAVLLAVFLYLASMRSEEEIGHGKQRIAWLQKVSDLDGKTIEELRLLLNDLEALEDSEPDGYEEEGDEPKDKKLRSLKRKITTRISEIEAAAEALVDADRLIREGDALLSVQILDIKGARAKYRAAQERCAERAAVVTERLARVDQAELGSLHGIAIRSYHSVLIHPSIPEIQKLIQTAEMNLQMFINIISEQSAADSRKSFLETLRKLSQTDTSSLSEADKSKLDQLSTRAGLSSDKILEMFQYEKQLKSWPQKTREIHTLGNSLAHLPSSRFKPFVKQVLQQVINDQKSHIKLNDKDYHLSSSELVLFITYLKNVLLAIRDQELKKLRKLHPKLSVEKTLELTCGPHPPRECLKLRSVIEKVPFMSKMIFEAFKASEILPTTPGMANVYQLQLKARLESFMEALQQGESVPGYSSKYELTHTFIENAFHLHRHVKKHGLYVPLTEQDSDFSSWILKVFRQTLPPLRFKLTVDEQKKLLVWMQKHFSSDQLLVKESERIFLGE
jgi:serine/threonine protein kinase